MKRFLIAMALTCVLSVSAYAGEMPMTSPAPGNIPMTSPAPAPAGATQASITATVILAIISLIRS